MLHAGGVDAILGAFVALAAGCCFIAGRVPVRGRDVQAIVESTSVWRPGNLMALMGTSFFMLSAGCYWTYIALIGQDAGFDEAQVARSLVVGVAAGFIGALTAVCIGSRLPRNMMLTLGTVMVAASVLVLLGHISRFDLVASWCLLNFSWNFSVAFQFAGISSVDSSGRAVALAPAFQSAGASVGPAIAALFVAPHAYASVMWLVAGRRRAQSSVFYPGCQDQSSSSGTGGHVRGAAGVTQASPELSEGSVAYRPISRAIPQRLTAAGPASREEMEAFIDGFMAAQWVSGTVAGATVSVAKDGRLFFAKGYGFADVEKQIPVDAAHTLFRPGSISKLLTWTSVMQLVERGQLDLDADVNAYLKAPKIPETQVQPITLRNLMTHTPGLEDGMTGFLFAASEEENSMPVSAWLTQHLPARVRPPTRDFSSGTNAAYSNWGVALAGHIVATVSGMPFDDYVEERVLGPLGMRRSTFREPLPAALAQDMSGGYGFENGALTRKEFELIHVVGPAGSLSAPATDMARFMLALLQGGALDGARILSPESVRRMLTRTMSPDPALNGSTLGFYETWINGRRIVGHAGHTIYFHSILALMPEENLGLFVSVNTAGHGEEIARGLESAFVRHYFPADLPPISPPEDAVQRNARYAGTYRSLRRSYTTWEKVLATQQDVHVRPMTDGTLCFSDPAYLKPARWIEVGGGVFRKSAEDMFVAFKFEAGSDRARFLVGPFSPIAAERIRWYETGRCSNVLAAIAGILFASLLASALYHYWADHAGTADRWARPLLAVAGLLLAAFAIGLRRVIASKDLTLSNIPFALNVILALPLLAVPLVACAVVFTARLWLLGEWSLVARLQYTVTTLAALALFRMLRYWNLLGYRFG